MTLPNFIIVGAEKCGTTALHAHLGRHPQAFMSDPKEPSFFVSEDKLYVGQDMGELVHEYIPSLPEYEAVFAGVTDEKAIGEASPCYLYSTEAAGRIQERIPGARIVVILRNPAERAYSQFLYNQQKGWESRSLTFREALALEPERVERNAMWAFHYLARGRYHDQVVRYLDTFGEDRTLVLLYEDFLAAPDAVLARICEFLEIDPIPLTGEDDRRNVTALPRHEGLRALTERPNLLKSAVKRVLPQGLRRRILGQIRQWNSTKPPPEDRLLREINSSLEYDVRGLAERVGDGPLRWLG